MIEVESLGPDGVDLAAAWLSEPETNRWLTSEWRGKTISGAMVAIALRNKRNKIFVVRHDQKPCGLAALSEIDVLDGTAMLWYLLGDRCLANKGVMTSAVRSLVDIAFGEIGLVSLYAWTMEDNLPSQRLLGKIGFLRAGRIRKAVRSGSKRVDRLYFDLVSPSAAPLET